MAKQTPEERALKKKEYAKKHHALHRANCPIYKEGRKQYYLNNKEAYLKTIKKCHLKKRFGITWEEYEKMFEEQEGVCALCKGSEKDRMLSVDHCHVTGRVRGLLCGNCNRALGLLKDNKEVLIKAVEYV